jgi:integral membrane protein (TIGR01906 family)
MMKKRWFHLVQWLLVLTLPLLLFVVNMRIVNGHWFVRWEYGKAGFPSDDYGFSVGERTRLAEVCVDYLATNADISLLADLRLPDGEPAFDARQLNHMADVQFVFHRVTIVGVAITLVWGGGMAALAASSQTRKHAANVLLGGSLLALGLLAAIGAFMALSWWEFFSAFHRIFFTEGTWIFDYSDTLIRLFPERFWIDVAVTIVGLLVAEAIVLGAIGWAWRRKTRPGA